MALAVLDPADLTVKWYNDRAQLLLPEPHRRRNLVGAALTDILPVTSALGMVGRLDDVAHTGVPQHLTTHVVGGGTAGRTLRMSAYRLHTGELLLAAEQS